MQFSKWIELALIAALTPQALAQVGNAHDRNGSPRHRIAHHAGQPASARQPTHDGAPVLAGTPPNSDWVQFDDHESARERSDIIQKAFSRHRPEPVHDGTSLLSQNHVYSDTHAPRPRGLQARGEERIQSLTHRHDGQSDSDTDSDDSDDERRSTRRRTKAPVGQQKGATRQTLNKPPSSGNVGGAKPLSRRHGGNAINADHAAPSTGGRGVHRDLISYGPGHSAPPLSPTHDIHGVPLESSPDDDTETESHKGSSGRKPRTFHA
ncbi:hypothetical protein MCOR34_009627 [Pyricularia oryzae]|nr:hypothetical protein MCOR34_009627 [Pyricularia oryzae]KAI6564868.1 hypothetical protein MCOR04_009022 [Pyricularia oryzae]